MRSEVERERERKRKRMIIKENWNDTRIYLPFNYIDQKTTKSILDWRWEGLYRGLTLPSATTLHHSSWCKC